MNKGKNEGITLIALVITIIVLLILAGVSLSLVMGEEGLVGRTISAKEVNENAEEKELVELAVSTAQIDGKGIITTNNLNKALKETFDNDAEASENSEGWDYKGKKQYKIYQDGKVEEMTEGQTILPSGYQQVEYIGCMGTQYIESIYFPEEFRYEIECELTNYSSYYNIFDTGNGPDVMLWVTKGQLEANIYNKLNVPVNKKIVVFYDILSTNGEFGYIDGEDKGSSTFTKKTTNHIVELFNRNKGEIYRGKVYDIKIYDKNSLKHHFIPCYATSEVTDSTGKEFTSGTIGLFDFVEDKFYINKGTGTFEKENNV